MYSHGVPFFLALNNGQNPMLPRSSNRAGTPASGALLEPLLWPTDVASWRPKAAANVCPGMVRFVKSYHKFMIPDVHSYISLYIYDIHIYIYM